MKVDPWMGLVPYNKDSRELSYPSSAMQDKSTGRIAILNVCAPRNRAAICERNPWNKRDIQNYTIITADFKSSPSKIYRTIKKIRNEIEKN